MENFYSYYANESELFKLFKYLWHLLKPDSNESFYLLLAFITASIYAYYTYKIWKTSKDPVLRLQWRDISITNEEPFKSYRRNSDKKIKKIYNTFTDLQLVNDGNGSAINLDISTEYLTVEKSIPKIRKVTSIGPHGQTQLRYVGYPTINKGKIFNDEYQSYQDLFRITINYKDSAGGYNTNSFIVDEEYNDGFRIEN